jgi:ATP-dependent DNA helicase PIF1
MPQNNAVVDPFPGDYIFSSERREPARSSLALCGSTDPLDEVILSDEQMAIFQAIENSNDNFFITGKAGTGKSVLLRYLRNHSSRNLVVLAPTGLASLNVQGQTIHSFFRLPWGPAYQPKMIPSVDLMNTLSQIDMIVIDEISMVRVDYIDAMDTLCRRARQDSRPFGGVQVVMFGDPYQLSPIVGKDEGVRQFLQDSYPSPYFFDANVWQHANIQVHELETVFRQDDWEFTTILNCLRIGNTVGSILPRLNRRVVDVAPPNTIFLTTRNDRVTAINSTRLAALPGEEFVYQAERQGNMKETEFPTEEYLRLKVGAQVMFLRNDGNKRWVNGTIGTVASLDEDTICVEVDGVTHTVPMETWQQIRYIFDPRDKSIREEPVSSFRQYPLRLAWAITIHKSQGQTLTRVVVDLAEGAFAAGQAYVALSRCRDMENLYLTRPIVPKDIRVDPDVRRFMKVATGKVG